MSTDVVSDDLPVPLPDRSYDAPSSWTEEDVALYRELVDRLHSDNKVLVGLRTIQAITIERLAHAYVALRRDERAPIVSVLDRKQHTADLKDWNDSFFAWVKLFDEAALEDHKRRRTFASLVGIHVGQALEENTGRGKLIKNDRDLTELKRLVVAAIGEAIG